VIRVGDRGAGVAPQERERIFEAFYRPQGTAPDAGGAGLGLAIARQLAAAQGGTVEYEPRTGGGSVFVLELPAEPRVRMTPRGGVLVAAERESSSGA
jgi:signal transduction histidine kinase